MLELYLCDSMFFHFGMDVTEIVKQHLEKAQDYIRISIFQLHDISIFDLLLEKVKNNVKLEIFTLPYDSIWSDNKEEIKSRFEILRENCIKLHIRYHPPS